MKAPAVPPRYVPTQKYGDNGQRGQIPACRAAGLKEPAEQGEGGNAVLHNPPGQGGVPVDADLMQRQERQDKQQGGQRRPGCAPIFPEQRRHWLGATLRGALGAVRAGRGFRAVGGGWHRSSEVLSADFRAAVGWV